jgi:hypothetical protein
MLDQSIHDLLDEVGEVAGRVGGELDAAPHELAIATLFDRCRSTFGAVRLLLTHDFAHEAVMLGRSLFTESLMLAELAAANETRRAELVVGWWMASLADLEGIVREGEARGDDAPDELAGIAERRTKIERYAADRGVGTRHWKPDEKALAAAHGRAAEYIDFRLTHHFVHGSSMAAEQRQSKADDNLVVVGGPGADVDTWGLPAGLSAATSLLHACRAACAIFGLSEPPELEPLLRRVDEAIVEINPPVQTSEFPADGL